MDISGSSACLFMDDSSEQPDQEADLLAVVLAAGMGTRMRSTLPKVLHPVAGAPLISHVLDAALGAGVSRILVVVGHQGDRVRAALGESVPSVLQEPQLGTGHAVQQAMKALNPVPSRILVLCGDTPLLTSRTIAAVLEASGPAAVTLLSAHVSNPNGYGRVVRGADGRVLAIVEEVEAGDDVRATTEINSGLYCFDGLWLAASLPNLRRSPKGEYYLTDLVGLAVAQGREVRAVVAEDPTEVLGVNDRAQLADADRILRERFCRRLMARGVSIVDPAATYIGKDVRVGADTVIHPGTHLQGRTIVGERCEVGPNSIIVDSTIGDDCTVLASVLEQCRVADRVSIGPFSHLRPGATIATRAKIGNYAEVKNSAVGEGVQMHHFSYVGDAEVGSGTNIGAGTITCNFNKRGEKHRTRVGKGVFLGSDTLLIAPVSVGDEASTAAGAVVTRDVPPGKLAIGIPARIMGGGEQKEPPAPNLERADGDEGGS